MEVNKKDKQKSRSQLNGIAVLIMLIALSISSGAVSGLWFAKKYAKQIAVIDVEQIVQKRKDEFTAKYRARHSDDMRIREEMMTDITQFAQKLEDVLKEVGEDKIILTKSAVVSDAEDITAVVKERVWGK